MSERPPEQSVRPRPDPGREPVLYVVATVHLDTQWRWTVRDAIRDFLPATLEQNFAHFAAHPRFVVSFEGAFRYRLMAEYYPADFERLKRWVARGRWHPAGSMLDAPDVNLASPEALVRHILYANRFFERELGRRSADLFLPDCFGFGWALPSIAAHCGVKGFSAQKFGNWQGETPFPIGVWRGPDGRGVVAALRPEGYGEGLDEDLSQAARWRQNLAEQKRISGLELGYKYVGIGDRGGALDEESVRWLERSLDGEGPVRVVLDASDRMYRDLTEEQVAALPRYDGELLLPVHGTGCLTSQAAMKRWNRKNELLADAAERAAAAAAVLAGERYPHGQLTDAWQRFLWHQMHDDLTGTSIPAAYEISWNDELLALNRFATVLTDAVAAVGRCLDTRGEGRPLVVYNPLSVEREDLVEVALEGDAPAARITGPDGEGVPCQVVTGAGGGRRVVFLARLPPVGFAVFHLLPAAEPKPADVELKVSPAGLENRRYRVGVDRRGDVRSVVDKRLGRELLSAPVRLALLADRSPRWPAWEVHWRDLSSPPREWVGEPAEVRVAERGPARVALEIVRRAGRSTFVQRLSLAAGDAGDRLEWGCEIRWRSRGRLLKAVFPLAAANPRAAFDLGLGVIERGNARPGKYEVPAQQWADLSDAGGEFGVSVLTDSRYGWDKPDDSTLRLSLLRSPWTWRKFLHQASQDHGLHRTRFALAGHAGGWADGDTAWQAARFNQPPLAFAVEAGAGPLGCRLSLLSVSHRAVAVRALKRAEDDDGWIVRLQELSGRPATARVEAAAPITTVTPVDGMEDARAPARLGGPLRAELGAFEPAAFKLELGPTVHRVEPPAMRPVELPRNRPAASRQGQAVDFDGGGQSFPAELVPAVVESGGLEFHLAPGGACCHCHGQRIELPEGDWDRLWLLACAVGGDRTAGFRVGDREREVNVADWSEPLGCWRQKRWGRILPGTLKRDAVAYYASHRHDAAGADQPYVFCYLFRYRLALPAGAASLTLPDEPRIRLFAALAERGGPDARPAAPLYD